MSFTIDNAPVDAPGGRQPKTWPVMPRGLAFPLAVFAASRLLTLAATGAAMLHKSGLQAIDAFRTWDSVWYVTIAQHGYPRVPPTGTDAAAQSTLAFFPMIGLLARFVAWLTGLPHWVAGLVATTAAGAGAVVAVWLLARHLGDEKLANRSAVVVAFFPGAFAFGFVYAEPLLVALAAGCLLALLRRNWLLAGGLAALATATRPTAIVLAACCALEAGRAVLARREWRALIAPALAPLGMLSFFGFLHHHTGDARSYQVSQQRGWGQQPSIAEPFHQIVQAVTGPLTDVNMTVSAIGTVFVVACGVLLVRWRPPPVILLYAFATTALAAVSVKVGTHPRFILASFPLLMALAARLRPRAFTLVVAGFAVLLPILTVVTVTTTYITP